MAQNGGYVAVWLDANRDKDAAYIAVEKAFPGMIPQFLNPRHFAGISSTGIDARMLRGHALATDSQEIAQAYAEAGIDVLVLEDVPLRDKSEPECVVIYTVSNDNEINDHMRMVARSTFPGRTMRPMAASGYSGPLAANVVAVVLCEGHEKIAADYTRLHKQIITVRRPQGAATAGEDSEVVPAQEIEASAVEATLKLHDSNLKAVISAQRDTAFLRALAAQEAVGANRTDIHRAIDLRLADMGAGGNPHYQTGPVVEEVVEEEEEEEKDDEAPTDSPDHPHNDMSFVADMSVRKITAFVSSCDDVPTLQATLAAEERGKARASAIDQIKRRLQALDGE